MNRKKSIVFVAGFAILIALYLVYINSYTEFQGIIYNKHTDIFDKVPMNKNFYKNIETVLSHYHKSYKVGRDGKILIKRNLASDEELIWNYTIKAQDTVWLKNFGVESVN